jgi:molybdopterin converting factor small subunit
MTVHFFAAARDLSGATHWVPEGPSPASVGELRSAIVRQFPVLAEVMPRWAISVNLDFANDDMQLKPGDEIAVLPPVSGG